MGITMSGTNITFNDSTVQWTAGGGDLVQLTYYTSTQTITIPTGATKAIITLLGGGGGGGLAGCGHSVPGGAGGGGARKYLTGLTPGATLALTVGGRGGCGGGTGGISTLASGNQSIGTLTANGGAGSGGVGGTASGGDINAAGQPSHAYGGGGGEAAFGYGSGYYGTGGFGGGGGGGGTYPQGQTQGCPGGCEIFWYK